MSTRVCMAYMRKTALQRFINIKFKFCCWGLCPQTPTGVLPLDPAGGLLSLRPPEIWTSLAQKPSYTPAYNLERVLDKFLYICKKIFKH